MANGVSETALSSTPDPLPARAGCGYCVKLRDPDCEEGETMKPPVRYALIAVSVLVLYYLLHMLARGLR